MAYKTHAEIKARMPFRPWFDSLIDYLLVHPTATLAELSAHFKRGPNTISLIKNSDMFKARFDQRREEMNQHLGAAVQRKLLGVLDLSLDIVKEQMETKRAQLPFKDTSAFVNTTLERLGYGVKQNPSVVVNNGPQAVTISANDLAEARELLRRSEAAKLIEQTPAMLAEARKSDAA